MTTCRTIGEAGDGYLPELSFRVLRADADDDVTVVVRTDDKTRACVAAERWLEKWADEYPDDILWLEERELTPWSTDVP